MLKYSGKVYSTEQWPISGQHSLEGQWINAALALGGYALDTWQRMEYGDSVLDPDVGSAP